MSTSTLGPVSRALLRLRDDKLRRCLFCGEWAYAAEPCTACLTPADDEQQR